MQTREIIPNESVWHKIEMKCDICSVFYTARVGTVLRQSLNGLHKCNICVRRENCKKVSSNLENHKKISIAKKGVKFSEAHKEAMSRRVVSEETKLKISQSSKNRIRKPRVCDLSKIYICGDCGISCSGREKTAIKQIIIYGHSLCIKCKSSRVGKIVGKKMAETYSKLYSGDNNFAKKSGVGEKISLSKKGFLLTDEHKKALRKPKSNTVKIKEAANRPEERERRSKHMANFMSQFVLNPQGIFKYCKTAYVKTNKTKCKIWCRSQLEQDFVNILSKSDKVYSIESAEKFFIRYDYGGVNRRYLPDFKVILIDGTIYFVETKSMYLFFNDDKTKKKIEALKSYCKSNGLLSKVLINKKEIEEWLEQLNSEQQ